MAGFLGQDWSFGALKNKLGGLLTDPEQAQALTENPLFAAGMGLLSENKKAYGGDPFAGIMGGLTGSKQSTEDAEDRKRIEDLRKQLADLIAAQQGGGAPGGGVPGQTPPIMPGQAGPMSPNPQPPPQIMDLLRQQQQPGLPGQGPPQGLPGQGPPQGLLPQAGGDPQQAAVQFLAQQGIANPSPQDLEMAMLLMGQ